MHATRVEIWYLLFFLYLCKHIMKDMDFIFETKMMVRDYECDIEGIVNNANYLHYIEHTRHLFLKERGLSFAEMHQKGHDAVVARINMQFKVPLRCDDASNTFSTSKSTAHQTINCASAQMWNWCAW